MAKETLSTQIALLEKQILDLKLDHDNITEIIKAGFRNTIQAIESSRDYYKPVIRRVRG